MPALSQSSFIGDGSINPTFVRLAEYERLEVKINAKKIVVTKNFVKFILEICMEMSSEETIITLKIKICTNTSVRNRT
jgi:hypothetical protein